MPDGETKCSLLAAVASARKAIPLAVALRVLRLPPARFHAWRSLADNCTLDDRSSYPHATPAQLTAEEIATIEKLIAFYVEQQSGVVPRAAFAGQTPDEMSNRELSCGASGKTASGRTI